MRRNEKESGREKEKKRVGSSDKAETYNVICLSFSTRHSPESASGNVSLHRKGGGKKRDFAERKRGLCVPRMALLDWN